MKTRADAVELTDADLHWMREAISEARKSAICQKEHPGDPPNVGAVLVDSVDGVPLARGHRSGNDRPGEHAEVIALDSLPSGSTLAHATLYTTLEPCIDARSPKNRDCALRIVDRGIERVIIGMLDPDLRVGSKGCRYLQDHGITVIVVEEVRDEIEELNHSFIAHKLVPQLLGTPEAKTAERITNRATLSFIDDLNPDPHDLTSFVELFARGEAVTPKIRWSTVNDRVLVQAIKDKIAYVQQIRLAATGAGNQPSIAHIQADWLQLVDGVINRAIAIRSRAARRIPLMWTGMRGFWRQHTPDAFLEALRGFLVVCNAEILIGLHKMQLISHQDLFPTARQWYATDRYWKFVAYPALFAFQDDDFCEVRLRRIGSQEC